MTRVDTFEVLVGEPAGERWVRAWGDGGVLGDGSLHIYDGRPYAPERLEMTTASILSRAQARAREGQLSEVVEDDPSNRIRLEGRVLAARAVAFEFGRRQTLAEVRAPW